MTKTKTYCDKCGIELISMKDYEDIDIEINHYYKRVDLCSNCFEKLTDIVECFLDKETSNKQHDEKGEGEWVRQGGEPEAICSNCGRDVVYQIVDNKWQFEEFCPHCGLKMLRNEEG